MTPTGFDPSLGTTLLFSDASSFPYTDSLICHISDQIQACNYSTVITYENLPTEKLQTVLRSLDDLFERHSCRIGYNAILKELRICVRATLVHECHLSWIKNVLGEWLIQGIITFPEYEHLLLLGSPRKVFSQGPYAGSVKEPDLFIRAGTLPDPTVIVETGWCEPYNKLLDDMNLWLVGGNGAIKAAIILDWQRRANRVEGSVELYVWDRQGMPTRVQREQIFPIPAQQAETQALHLSRRQIFGSTVFPGTNPRQILDLRLDLLRDVARIEIGQMGLVPA